MYAQTETLQKNLERHGYGFATLRRNGELKVTLPWWWAFGKEVTFIGGPFRHFSAWRENSTESAIGICLREDPQPGMTYHLPIEDFSIPEQSPSHINELIAEAYAAALEGKIVYVGCMGGWGRTGLFMSLLAKAAGIDDPVQYVRDNYTPSAVETTEQKQFVEEFDTSSAQRRIGRLLLTHYIERAKALLFFWR